MVTIGQILKPFGIRGEVRVESLTDVPGRFEGLTTVTLVPPNGEPIETTVTTVREIHQGWLLGFSAFSTPEAAAPYRKALIQVPELADLPRDKDTFYQFELIGLRVHDSEGIPMGEVKEIMEFPQHHVLVVRNQKQEFLIPATRRSIEMVDLDDQKLRLRSQEWWDVSYAL